MPANPAITRTNLSPNDRTRDNHASTFSSGQTLFHPEIRKGQVHGRRQRRPFRRAAAWHANKLDNAGASEHACHLKQANPFVEDRLCNRVRMAALQKLARFRGKQGMKHRTVDYVLQTVP